MIALATGQLRETQINKNPFLFHCFKQDLPKDCLAIQDDGQNVSGEYFINPQDGGSSFPVYCDMDTDGGGWLVSLFKYLCNCFVDDAH